MIALISRIIGAIIVALLLTGFICPTVGAIFLLCVIIIAIFMLFCKLLVWIFSLFS